MFGTLNAVITELSQNGWRAINPWRTITPISKEVNFAIGGMNYGDTKEIVLHNVITGGKAKLVLSLSEGEKRDVVKYDVKFGE